MLDQANNDNNKCHNKWSQATTNDDVSNEEGTSIRLKGQRILSAA